MAADDYENAGRIQKVINDDLFPTMQHISDVKQVLAFMADFAAPLSEEQLRALLLLESLGSNKRLHVDGNPYKTIIADITGKYKHLVAKTDVFLNTIEELIPKPPKPIIFAGEPKAPGGQKGK